MAANDLTALRLRDLLHYDPETGVFMWREPQRRRKIGVPAGSGPSRGRPYITIGIDKATYTLHRLAWLYVHGRWPTLIDHINGNTLDNRLLNLREVDGGMNSQNIRKAFGNSSHGYLGAYFHKSNGRWNALIMVAGQRHNLGYYRTAEEAHEAYMTAKRKLHPGCTI